MRSLAVTLVALALAVAGCSKSEAPDASGKAPPKGSPSAKTAQKAEDAPGSAKLASPEDNYVAAAVKLGCAGMDADDPDKLAQERARILAAHGYTEASWIEASSQLGVSKGDTITREMETKCPL